MTEKPMSFGAFKTMKELCDFYEEKYRRRHWPLPEPYLELKKWLAKADASWPKLCAFYLKREQATRMRTSPARTVSTILTTSTKSTTGSQRTSGTLRPVNFQTPRRESSDEELAPLKPKRRWRMWNCICVGDQGFLTRSDCLDAALQEIDWIDSQGVKAKVWAPLPGHEGSGHVHIVILASLHEKLRLLSFWLVSTRS